jgi:TRAP-type C4-dicarboxylate transport system permease small subunit
MTPGAEAADRHAVGRPRLRGIEIGITRSVEVLAAFIMLIETLVLFGGVVSRLLRHPFTWSDEFASILFLWLAMFGSVIALQRGEHMRLTTFVTWAAPALRGILDALGMVVPIAFLVWLLPYAMEHTISEAVVSTPSLEWSASTKIAAIPVGAALMIALSLIRLLETVRLRDLVIALLIVAAVAAALWLGTPALKAMGKANLIVFFIVLVGVCVLIGAPIGFAFGLATLAYLATVSRAPLTIIVSRMDEGMSHIVLLSVPLFVFLGYLIEGTGLARSMVVFLAALVGHVRAGLAYVLLAAIYLVSGISGSKAADMAAVAPVLFPEMKQRGYKPGELVALLSSSGAMSETIPPSLVLITLGSVVAGVSIADLFIGGLLPALILALALCVVCWWRFRDVGDHSALARSHNARLGRRRRLHCRSFHRRAPAGPDPGARALRRLLVALPRCRHVERRARDLGRGRTHVPARASGLDASHRHTHGRGRGMGDRNGGLRARHRLDLRDRARVRSASETEIPLEPAVRDAGGDRGTVRRHSHHHRRSDGHVLGVDAVGLLATARRDDGGGARRQRRLPRHLDPCVRGAGLDPGRNSSDRVVRASAVSDRTPVRNPRGALRHGRHPRHGNWLVRPALRRRLLRRLRHRQGQSGRGRAADLGLPGGAPRGLDRRGRISRALDGISALTGPAACARQQVLALHASRRRPPSISTSGMATTDMAV